MRFRIGIHVGDVMVQGDNLFGDAVNVAARLEALAEPGGICISGAVRDHIGTNLSVGLTDLGPQGMKNITQPIRAFRISTATSSVIPVPSSSLPLPDKPSIAVLPFLNMSGDPEQEYFADGMVEEIITALSRIRWLFVIARNSTFTYKGQSVGVKQVGRELGVRYVLEGSVRKAGQRVRITGQLIDALTGTHLWADRFDGSLENIFELQDEVAISVAGAIEPALEAAEIRRSTTRPTHDLNAYDIYLRALPHWNSLQKQRLFLALDLLGQAIERDPHYGPALALAAHTRQFLAANDWVNDLEPNRREGLGLARRALQSAPDNPDVLALAGFALGHFGEDINVALGLIDRAVTLNPSSARGWFLSGVARLLAGQPDLAIKHFETSMRLTPRDRGRISSGIGMGGAHLFNRRFEEGAVILLASLQQAPDVPIGYRFLAACYAHMGQLDKARETVKRLREITPVVIPSVIPYRNPEHRELLLSGLRLAAGEET
jgi:TolB-like protein